MSAKALRYPTLLAVALAFLGCSEEPVERTDLLSLTLTEAATAVVDPEKDELRAGTDSLNAPGTLNIAVRKSDRFSLAGVPIDFDSEKPRPSLDFMLYSPKVLKSFRERVERQEGGAEFSIVPLKQSEDLAAQLQELGAFDRIIGFVYGYRDNKGFAEVDAALRAKLGAGRRIEHLDRGDFWVADDKVIALAPDYNTIYAFHLSQVWQNCLLTGAIGVIDLDGCDREAFGEVFLDVFRQEPPNPPAK